MQKGLALILIMAAIMGGYLVYSGKFNLNKFQLTSSPTSQSIPTTDETSSWQTYQQDAYSLKYPQGVNLKELTPTKYGKNIVLSLTSFGPIQSNEIKLSDNIGISIAVGSVSGKTFDEFIESERARDIQIGTLTNIVKENVGNKEGQSYEVTGRQETNKRIYIPLGEDKYLGVFYFKNTDSTNKRYQEVIDQILSTFKFQ